MKKSNYQYIKISLMNQYKFFKTFLELFVI
jgi:hypothetical protein